MITLTRFYDNGKEFTIVKKNLIIDGRLMVESLSHRGHTRSDGQSRPYEYIGRQAGLGNVYRVNGMTYMISDDIALHGSEEWLHEQAEQRSMAR